MVHDVDCVHVAEADAEARDAQCMVQTSEVSRAGRSPSLYTRLASSIASLRPSDASVGGSHASGFAEASPSPLPPSPFPTAVLGIGCAPGCGLCAAETPTDSRKRP